MLHKLGECRALKYGWCVDFMHCLSPSQEKLCAKCVQLDTEFNQNT